MNASCAAMLIAAAAGLALVAGEARGDRIVFRNFDILDKITVTSFDADGVKLSDDKLIGWDRVDKGSKVAADKQAAFDKMRQQIGEPLYRVRQRMRVGDYAGLLANAEAIYPQYEGRESDSAYMVTQGLMWGRIAVGRRESALEPYLRCLEIFRARKKQPPQPPGDRRLKYDPESGICADLPPIYFDKPAAKAALPSLLKTIGGMRKPRPPATRIYYAALAFTAGEDEKAMSVLKPNPESSLEIQQLREILLAQRSIGAKQFDQAERTLAALLPKVAAQHQPLARYWLGRAKTGSKDPDARLRGLLELMRIPALHGRQQPELAAAALYQTMSTLNELKDARGGVAVRRELLENFGRTYHAALLKRQESSR